MKRNHILFICLLAFFSSCTNAKLVVVATSGQFKQSEFTEEMDFRYVNKHIFVDVVIKGKTYNFLFDTGWDITCIDNRLSDAIDFESTATAKVNGSSIEKHATQFGFLSELRIKNAVFENLGVCLDDLSFINKAYACERKVDGVLGANIFRKANWEIDYERQIIRFSDDLKNLKIGDNAIALAMIPKNAKGWGGQSVKLSLDGIEEHFIIDTGSSGGFTLNTSFYDAFKAKKHVFILRGNQIKNELIYKNHLVLIDKLQMGELEINNAELSLEKGVSRLIGNRFLENFKVVMDWPNNKLYLTPVKELPNVNRKDFPLLFKPNYSTNKIEISGKYSGLGASELKIGTEVTFINTIDVSNLSADDLCVFWESEWPEIKQKEKISLRFKGSNKEVVLRKEALFANNL